MEGAGSGTENFGGFSFGTFMSITTILCLLILVGLVFKARAEEPLLLYGFEKTDEPSQVLDAELVLDEPSSLEADDSS